MEELRASECDEWSMDSSNETVRQMANLQCCHQVRQSSKNFCQISCNGHWNSLLLGQYRHRKYPYSLWNNYEEMGSKYMVPTNGN